MIKMEARIPRRAMSWREKSEVPQSQVKEGSERGAEFERTTSVTRESRFWAGRIPCGPRRPGSWGRRERKAKR